MLFIVYDELGFAVVETDNEEEAEFFAWSYGGYYIEEEREE